MENSLSDLADQVEALEDRLGGLARNSRELSGDVKKLGERMHTLEHDSDAAAVTQLTARVELIEARLSTLEDRVVGLGTSSGPSGEAGGSVEPAALASLEDRLSTLEHTVSTGNGGGGGGGGGEASPALPPELDLEQLSTRLIDAALQPIMRAIDSRLAKLSEGLAVEASTKALEAVEGRIEELGAQKGEPESEGLASGVGEGDGNYNHKRFVALAREVMSLREATAKQPQASAEVVGLLNSPEFKELFDTKVNQVMSYMKSDVIPSAVKKALQDG